jgi:hypothetical protein
VNRQGAALLAAAFAAASCGGPREQAPADASQAPASAAPATAQPSAPQWPPAANINTAARSALPPEAASRLQESPVPVLIPNDAGMLAAAAPPIVDANKYTFTSRMADVTVSVQASAAAPPSGGRRMQPLPRVRVAGREIFVTENEGIRVATWKENGVAYSAEVECAKAEDVRCRDNSYLFSIVEKLAFVGGRGARVP